MYLLRLIDEDRQERAAALKGEYHHLLDQRCALERPTYLFALTAKTRAEIEQASLNFKELKVLDQQISDCELMIKCFQLCHPVEKLVCQGEFMLHYPLLAKTTPFLRHLDLSNNDLRIVPREICRLSHLKILVLADNRIHSFSAEFPKLTQLIHLDLRDNEIILPPWETLATFTHLVTLDLRRNGIAHPPPFDIPCTYVHLFDSPPTPRPRYLMDGDDDDVSSDEGDSR